VVDHHQPVAGLLDLGEQVAGDEHGGALVGQAAQQVADLDDPGRVQPVGRLVQHQQRRVGQQRGGDAEALLHAQRVGAVGVVGPVGQPDQLQHLLDLGAGVAAEHGQDVEVAAGGQGRVERRPLDHRPDPG
jgi:hypothetical protein